MRCDLKKKKWLHLLIKWHQIFFLFSFYRLSTVRIVDEKIFCCWLDTNKRNQCHFYWATTLMFLWVFVSFFFLLLFTLFQRNIYFIFSSNILFEQISYCYYFFLFLLLLVCEMEFVALFTLVETLEHRVIISVYTKWHAISSFCQQQKNTTTSSMKLIRTCVFFYLNCLLHIYFTFCLLFRTKLWLFRLKNSKTNIQKRRKWQESFIDMKKEKHTTKKFT